MAAWVAYEMPRPARSKSSALSGHPTSTIEAAVACGFVAIAQITDLHGEIAQIMDLHGEIAQIMARTLPLA